MSFADRWVELVMAQEFDRSPVGASNGTLIVKRMFDIAASTIAISLLAPFLLVIAAAIKLDSRGPALFRQIRVGKAGRPFRICKFRTMVDDASRRGTALTVKEDPRITRLGAFLREWKLDELPQLFNVLAGQMTLVGPRPEVPEYMAFYSDEQRQIILSMRPGITDYAAILFRNESEMLEGEADPVETYRHRIMPAKFKLYERYYRNIGLFSDLRLIVSTLAVLASPRVLDWLNIEHDPSTLIAPEVVSGRTGKCETIEQVRL